MSNLIEIKNLVKDFGSLRAVNHITFSVEEGQVYGLLGPNGSGKSTTIKILLGLLRPTEGSVQVLRSTDPQFYCKHLGVLMETFSFYPYLSAQDNLKIFCEIKGVPLHRGLSLMEKMGIAQYSKMPFRNFSLGMKQRFAFVIALLKDVPIYVFDEPTNGMDAFGIIEVRNWILSLQKEGKTILICSHLLSEMEKVCTHVGMISKGHLVYNGPLSELLNQYASLENAFVNLVQNQNS